MAIQNDVVTGREQAFEAVAETDHFPAEFLGGEDNAAQHSIQTGAITTAR